MLLNYGHYNLAYIILLYIYRYILKIQDLRIYFGRKIINPQTFAIVIGEGAQNVIVTIY